MYNLLEFANGKVVRWQGCSYRYILREQYCKLRNNIVNCGIIDIQKIAEYAIIPIIIVIDIVIDDWINDRRGEMIVEVR